MARRDNFICQDCGLDCDALRWAIRDLRWGFRSPLTNGFLRAAGIPLDRRRFWEAHHQIPLSEGGLNTLENGVTLCWRCHKKRHATRKAPA